MSIHPPRDAFSGIAIGVSSNHPRPTCGKIRNMQETSRGRPGRKPKLAEGRVYTAAKIPLHYREVLDRQAEEEGIPLGDVITRLLGERLGLPVPAYCRPRNQEALPLDQAS